MKTFMINFLKWFLIINTGELVIVGINIFRYDTITTMIVPQIFATSIATSLVTTIFFSIDPKKPVSRPLAILYYFIHYLVLCITIMTLGALFKWFPLSLSGVAIVMLSVAGVYVISYTISGVLSKSEADKMTSALKDYKDE